MNNKATESESSLITHEELLEGRPEDLTPEELEKRIESGELGPSDIERTKGVITPKKGRKKVGKFYMKPGDTLTLQKPESKRLSLAKVVHIDSENQLVKIRFVGSKNIIPVPFDKFN